MNATAVHVSVARQLERSLHSRDGCARSLDCKPAIEALQQEWNLEAAFLFTCPDESAPEAFELHDLTSEKDTPFLNVKLDADSSEFIRSFAKSAVLHWTPLLRLRHTRDRLWELFWQSMTLGPYPGPWEISSVVLRNQDDLAGLLVLIRDSNQPWAGPEGGEWEMTLKLLAHQFYTSERLAFAQAALAEERHSAGATLFDRVLSRAKGNFAHGVFARLQTISLLISNAKEPLQKNNRPPVEEALDSIGAVAAEIHRLIKDVLSLDGNTVRSGRPAAPGDWVNVRGSIAMMERNLGPLTKTTSKSFSSRIEAPEVFPMYKKDFDEILENLLHNAIKYSGDSEKIKITLSHGTRRSMLDVSSIGIAIPRNVWDRIFERGYRTKEAAMITTNALGIGLFQARGLAENAGAKLFVQSSEPLDGHQVRIMGRHYPAHRNKFRLLATR